MAELFAADLVPSVGVADERTRVVSHDEGANSADGTGGASLVFADVGELGAGDAHEIVGCDPERLFV